MNVDWILVICMPLLLGATVGWAIYPLLFDIDDHDANNHKGGADDV